MLLWLILGVQELPEKKTRNNVLEKHWKWHLLVIRKLSHPYQHLQPEDRR